MFRNLQIRSKLVAIVVVPLLAVAVFATVAVVSSVSSRLEADRLNRATQFAVSLTGLADALQRERAISSGYVASGKQANYGTMIADRVLVNTAVQSFQRSLRSLDTGGFPGQFRRDLAAANGSLDDLTAFRSRMEGQATSSLQVAGYYGGQINALLAVISDIGAMRGSGSLGGGAAALSGLSRAKESASQAQGLLFSVLTAGSFGPEVYQQFATLTGEEQAYLAQFRLAATADQRAFFGATVTGPDIDRTDGMRQAALTARDLPRGIRPKDWYFASSAKVDLLHQAELRVAGDVAAASGAAKASAIRRATAELVAVALVVGLALGSSLLVARSLARPLVVLERRVREVAESELPGVVERLQRASEGADLTVIAQQAAGALEIQSTDEIGRLATAFNSVHRVAIRVATEQAALRKSIGDMFVNLARRSQSLIDRQLNLIEELERRTDDPDHLDELFQLDHLATRMRRNAENLLVLASAEPGRRWSEPIALADVLRAAGSEVEDFTRVELMTGDEVRVVGHATSDVVHLLAELIENAISFSSPETPVRVAAQPTATGYLIEIEDRGLGMTEDELAAANDRLANPPEIDFALSRMLGFFVVGRLADRHGIQVQLRRSWYGGVTALVLVPTALLLAEPAMAWSATGAPRRQAPQLAAPGAWPGAGAPAPAGLGNTGGFDIPAPAGHGSTGGFDIPAPAGRAGGGPPGPSGAPDRGAPGPRDTAGAAGLGPLSESTASSVFEPLDQPDAAARPASVFEPPAPVAAAGPSVPPVPPTPAVPLPPVPSVPPVEPRPAAPRADPAPAATGDGGDLFDDYRTGMMHGRVAAQDHRPDRPPAAPPADGSPPPAS